MQLSSVTKSELLLFLSIAIQSVFSKVKAFSDICNKTQHKAVISANAVRRQIAIKLTAVCHQQNAL
jgi:hypothetical protein